ncbi:hypothetical protein XA68_15949 [Ophiocordyceps unilateralis]|uniref:Myb-like domain-containing protein n=1 Tax=Ophiocordyceps unilateralis TaxID=268505 RepID=A0A2A9P6K4_OPHUN|nr:hypothetical protein XA68_15949 [Ophiocordyceps unilateralis]
MATIEPRLIHLLNESTTPQLQHADLPPFYALPLPTSDDLRSLPPLEPDAGLRFDRYADLAAFAPVEDAATVRHVAYPLRPLLAADVDAPDARVQPADAVDGKKRKDDFVQLPQPVKKQKAAQQAPAMPPIINGLHEPPPHAALFPPIAQHDAGQLKLLCDLGRASADDKASVSDVDKTASRARKRAAKPRRKWSEEETKHLLLGVNRHGVGKWTTILEDPDFTFNDRTAGDLKDRFRTCCPVELRGPGHRSGSQPDSPPQPRRAKKGIHSENILIEQRQQPHQPEPEQTHRKQHHHSLESHSQGSMAAAPRQKKSRAHRKKMEDLAELGIHGPFKKSLRRERRPFTDADDREILEGLDIYGPAWTRIQRDPRFHLSSRQPTDLRDRVRNKYPGVYQRIEKGALQAKDENRGNDILEPSITMSIDDSLKRPKTTATGSAGRKGSSKEDLYTWPLMDSGTYVQPPQTFEFGEGASAPQFMGGEMDISRLLLDDSKLGPPLPRHAPDGASDPSSPSASRERQGTSAVKC